MKAIRVPNRLIACEEASARMRFYGLASLLGGTIVMAAVAGHVWLSNRSKLVPAAG
jgi:type IV secretory pathway TrbF-like protein